MVSLAASDGTPNPAYRLGLPAWAFPGWRGRYFDQQPSALASYARVFNTVEGNTTFYRIPDPDTVQSWRRAVEGTGFRFCFKLPRSVTHERTSDLEALHGFFAAIDPLGDHLGPVLLQFPATLGPDDLHALEALCSRLPVARRYALEVRHPRFFQEPGLLEPLLDRYGFGRVVFDTRALYEGDRRHPEVLAAVHEKPDLPVLDRVHNDLVFLRLLLHPDRLHNHIYIDDWARRLAAHLRMGRVAYVMIHCPNNLHCPALAAEFHAALGSQAEMQDLDPLPPWSVPQQQPLL
jgi:uncharacterized protein YecE (DUF72 family)